MSNIFACFLQSLACKLGSVTGKDLAQNCRQFLPNWLRWPLYILSELAIISTDLAEIIGGAIALNLLFGLNIVAGVVLTALDVFIILLLYRPNGTLRGIRWFEMGVSILVLGVVICFSVELAKTPNIDGKQVMKGFIPSGVIFTPDGIFASLGILGATIMPHALFLGSHVTLPRVREFDRQHHPERILQNTLGEEYKWQPSISAIHATLSYSISELVISLSTFAMFVNAAILIVAGTALYNTANPSGEDLFSIHALLSETLAPVAGTLFALALLFSGQSSSIIATIVGQIICEGFIDWRVRPWIRRGITRLIALVPCIIVASAIGKDGLSMALNISQVFIPLRNLRIPRRDLLYCILFPIKIFHSASRLSSCVSPEFLSSSMSPHNYFLFPTRRVS
jgi:metal iron transporter